MSRFQRVRMERPGAKSFFAFFLLPQFWRSMGHFSHIRPIFIQTLALMLAQAGLLPLNHPGARTGYHADGENVTTAELMGEAWFNLRTRPHMGIYQWGIFCSIVMMFICMVAAMVVSVVFLFSTTVAKAQIFQLVDGGGTVIDTSFGNIPTKAGGATIFDRSAPGTGGGSEDLAITILDKVLRQAAVGEGGTMQNAIMPMFGTYSTAVLVIASIVVFWAIVSIVIDTARTGQLGGGRHNMVWTPIRFVFALGLLVPIGGGFNSGQLMVMKLAEWGSNLGSNMWSTYLGASSTGTFLLSSNPLEIGTGAGSPNMAPTPDTENPTGSLLDPLITSLACMQRNNMANEIALDPWETGNYGAPQGPGGEWIWPQMDGWTDAGVWGNANPQYVRPMVDVSNYATNAPYINIHLGNATNRHMCGTLVMPNPDGNDILDENGDYLEPVEVAEYKQLNRQAEWNLLNNMWPQMLHAGCQIASLDQQADPGEYTETCPSGVDFSAPGGGFNGRPPSKAALDALVDAYMDARNLANRTNANTTIIPYVSPTGGLWTRAMAQGWAGMGGWYFQIAGINRTYNQSSRIEATSDPGNEGADGETESAACVGAGSAAMGTVRNAGGAVVRAIPFVGWGENMGGHEGLGSYAGCQTMRLLKQLAGETLSAFIDGGGFNSADAGDFPIQGWSDINLDAGKRVIQWVLKKMQVPTENQNGLIVSIGTYDSATHPMAQLSAVGYKIVDKALYIYGVIAFISLFAAIPLIGGFVTALMAGPVGSFLGMIASFGMMPGLMLLYYVPLIPWTKVMFAVVAWIVSVVEAVVTIPVVALAHLRTDGEGLMGPMAQGAYVAWLNLLLRPGLTVIGFVMGNLIFEAMVLFLNDTFNTALANMGTGGFGIIDQIVNTYIYVFAAYALVNACFKLVDIIPNSTMSWLGTSAGTQDFSQEAGQTEGFINQNIGEMAHGLGSTAGAAMAAPGMIAGKARGMVGGAVGVAALGVGGLALAGKAGMLGKAGNLMKGMAKKRLGA